MKVRISQPAKNAMQSGGANVKKWLVEHVPAAPKEIDGLMGWVGSRDTLTQLRLRFDSKEEAIAYCTRKGFEYSLHEDNKGRNLAPKNYSDNFKFDKLEFGRA